MHDQSSYQSPQDDLVSRTGPYAFLQTPLEPPSRKQKLAAWLRSGKGLATMGCLSLLILGGITIAAVTMGGEDKQQLTASTINGVDPKNDSAAIDYGSLNNGAGDISASRVSTAAYDSLPGQYIEESDAEEAAATRETTIDDDEYYDYVDTVDIEEDDDSMAYIENDDTTAAERAAKPRTTSSVSKSKSNATATKPKASSKPKQYTPPKPAVIRGAAQPYNRWLEETAIALRGSRQYVTDRVAERRSGQKYAINLDIDNSTLQSQYAPGKPIPATMALIRHAKSKGVYILFNTARPKDQRDSTVATLRKAGVPVDGICLKDKGESVVQSKQSCRNWFKSRGYTLIANVGNNTTDLAGGGYERGYALPSNVNGTWLH